MPNYNLSTYKLKTDDSWLPWIHSSVLIMHVYVLMYLFNNLYIIIVPTSFSLVSSNPITVITIDEIPRTLPKFLITCKSTRAITGLLLPRSREEWYFITPWENASPSGAAGISLSTKINTYSTPLFVLFILRDVQRRENSCSGCDNSTTIIWTLN